MDESQQQFMSHLSPAAADGMQTTETVGGGSLPQSSDGIRARPLPTARIRTADHILTAEEVVELLRTAGVGRSIRRVTEYCQRGDLDAFRDPDERRWYVTPASANELIKHFQELRSRHAMTADIRTVPSPAADGGTRPLATANDGSPRKPTAGSDPVAQTSEHSPAAAKQIKQLEDEVRGLEISNKAKDIVIGQLKEERTGFIKLLQKRAFTIGQLKAKLQLRAPISYDVPMPGTARGMPPMSPEPQTTAEVPSVPREPSPHWNDQYIEDPV